jgi:integrase
MPHFAKPFYREGRKRWCVQIDGKQINLGPDKDEAFRKYHEIMAARGQEPKHAPLPTSLHAVTVIDLLLDWCQKHREERTYQWYLDYLQSFAKTLPYGLLVTDLKPYHVEGWLDANPGWTTGRRGAITAVMRALNWAVKQGRIDKNPLRGIEKPAAGRRTTVITGQEVKEFLAKERDQEFIDLVTVAWETGCRPHEILTVEARHFDRERRCWIFPPEEAKGKRSWRVVYLTDTAFAITEKLAALHPAGPIFCNTDGDPWTPNSVNSRFEKRKKKTGRRWSLYAIRHSFATAALQQGVDAITTANLLGHADLTMLKKFYAHVDKNGRHMHEAAKKAARS